MDEQDTTVKQVQQKPSLHYNGDGSAEEKTLGIHAYCKIEEEESEGDPGRFLSVQE